MSNYTRMPVRFNPANQELLKSQVGSASPGPGWAGQREGTDWQPGEESAYQVAPGVQPQYRTPADRVSGNQLFRRYPNGALDVEYAKQCVVDALHRVKESGGHDQLNSLEKVALSVLFPMSFDYVPAGMAPAVTSVQLRLGPSELMLIREAVGRHLAEEVNWNAGKGGGSVPGRHVTRDSG
jgi:hypothetical protein